MAKLGSEKMYNGVSLGQIVGKLICRVGWHVSSVLNAEPVCDSEWFGLASNGGVGVVCRFQ